MEKNLSHHHSRNNPTRSSSLPKKPHNNGNGVYTSSVKTTNTVTTTTTYDDVFGGPPRFGPPTLSPRLEDYCEIFSGFNGSSRAAVSSIPILDLPLDKGLSFDVRRESFDYLEVFGGFDGLDSAPSYDELFRSTVADGDSSDGAWTPEEEEEVEEKSPSFSNGRDSYDSIEFNISYHKANQVNGGTSVSRVAPDLGCSSAVAAFEDKNGDQKYYSGATTSCLSEPFVTVSEIGLKTHPTGIPPPSRPPPVLKSDFRRSGSNSRTTGSEGSNEERSSPPFFDVEVDASSAAVREAMVKAEAKLKSAKEMFERKQTSMNGRMREEGKSSHAAGLDHKSLSSQGSVNSDGNEEWEEATQFVELVRTEQPRNADENSGGEDVSFPRSAGFFDQKLTRPANADWEKQQRRAKGDREEDHEAKKLPKHPGARKVASRHKRREDRLVEKAPEKLRDVELQFEIGNNVSDHGGIVKQRNLIRPEESKPFTEKLSKQKMADRRAAEKNLDNVFDWEQNARKLREALGLSDNESTLEVPLGTNGEMDESERKLKEALRRMEEETSSKEEASVKEETEAFEKAENEKRLKAALEQEEKLKKLKEENERREAEAREKAEQERRRKEQEEYELRLKEAFEKEEGNRRMREAREKAAEEERRRKEQEEYERRLKEAFEKEEEKNRRMREAREKAEAENARKMKEAREKEENERRRIKEAQEKAEAERRIQEEKERQIRELQEKEAYERRAKEALEQAENERKLKEENEKKLKEAIELEEKEKMLIEAFERAETERRLKEDLEQEEMRLQEANERERTQRENQERQEKERDERQGDTCEMEKTCETTNEALEEDERVDNHEPVNKVLVEEEEEEGPSQRVSVSEEACHWKVFEKNLKDASQKEGTNELDTESEKLNGVESGEESASVTEAKLNQKSKTVEERSEDEKVVKNGTVGGAKLERPLPSRVFMQREKEAERLKRELDSKMENLRKIEEEREREREREKDRMAFDQRALADARERLEKACAEARERSFPSTEARLRAERAAVERATVEARERAAEKAAFEARDRMERSVSDKQLGSFGERTEKQFQNSASFGASRYQNSPGNTNLNSLLLYTSRLERHRRTADRVAKALAEKNMRDLVAQREQAERVRIAETLDAEVKRWSSGKEGNIRALLSTLQYVMFLLIKEIKVKKVITSAAVKRAYRKATLCVHPDKLQQRGANIHQKYICEKVFDLLKEAWNRFNSEER
ncbi:hypothetical protein F2Q68_00028754 [Brassica cretica]|uniref:J domain-containing protein n=1 Tax=Brassica cretica TaxID=69181 RepID=A0A8S9G8J2_BRACR|nr:hypothetical protein F2Q68_00028754 [Brassica cretica]